MISAITRETNRVVDGIEPSPLDRPAPGDEPTVRDVRNRITGGVTMSSTPEPPGHSSGRCRAAATAGFVTRPSTVFTPDASAGSCSAAAPTPRVASDTAYGRVALVSA